MEIDGTGLRTKTYPPTLDLWPWNIIVSITMANSMQAIGYIVAWRSYSFVYTLHHFIITIMQILIESVVQNDHQIFSVECVSKIKSFLLVMFYAFYGVVCFQLTHSSFNDCEKINVLHLIIIIKLEIWVNNYCLGLGHETMVCVPCLPMFLLKPYAMSYCSVT